MARRRKNNDSRASNPSGHTKDLNEFLRNISRDPYNCEIDGRGKHYKIKCPGAPIVVSSKTPRSGYNLQETRSRLKRYGVFDLNQNPTKYKKMGVDYDPYANLRANQNNPYAFVHYSYIEKLGINPRSEFDTPLGIYAYPINNFPVENIIRGEVPFAGDRPYIHLFTVKPSGVVFIQNLSQEQDAYFGKLAEEHAKKYRISLRGSREQSGFGRYWYATHQITTSASMWRSKLVEDGVYGVVDYGSGLIHSSEPVQAVFFSKSSINHIGTFRKKETISFEDKLRRLDYVIHRVKLGESLDDLLRGADRFFRARVAEEIDPSYLPQMIDDKNALVRIIVVRRIDLSYLPQMIDDENYFVRLAVVERIDPSYLPQMLNDDDPFVQNAARGRLARLQQDKNPRRAKKLTHREDLPPHARKCHEMYERYLNTKNNRTLKACLRHCIEGTEHKDPEVRAFCKKLIKKFERKLK